MLLPDCQAEIDRFADDPDSVDGMALALSLAANTGLLVAVKQVRMADLKRP